MRRESHVRFREGGGVRFPSATRLVVGFEHREEAERFLAELRERFAKFGLALHPEKTRLLPFGRTSANRWRYRGGPKPGTFNFLPASCIRAGERAREVLPCFARRCARGCRRS